MERHVLDLNKLAEDACSAQDYKIKSAAQQKFFGICSVAGPSELQKLMNEYSETVLFVAMQYIYKVIPTSKFKKDIFGTINNIIRNWYSTNNNATLIRNGVELKSYVEKSCGRTLGQALKFIYIDKEQSANLVKFISDETNLLYKLFLWRNFIDTVSVVDNQLTFLVYRGMVYNFQENVIPLITDSLLPYFSSVKEQMEINQISAISAYLSISQRQLHGNLTDVKLFNPGHIKFTQLVFKLLKGVICFNYNITFSEYESDTVVQNCLVCFPDQVTRKLASQDFLISIFYVAEKLINQCSNLGKQKIYDEFLEITLECIQKIVLTKLFYTKSETKKIFSRTILKCMSGLMSSEKLNQATILSIIESNLNFLVNIDLFELCDINQNKQYTIWLQNICNLTMAVIQKSVIHYENHLVLKCTELVGKLVEETVSPKLASQLPKFRTFGIQISNIYVKRLFSQDYCLIGTAKAKNFQDIKKNLSSFLKRIRQLCCLSLHQFLNNFYPLMVNILQNDNINNISNVYFLLSEFMDKVVLERSMLGQMQNPQSSNLLGKVICTCLQWVSTYRSYNRSIQNIQISILLFTQKLLSEALSSLSSDDGNILITSQFYNGIKNSKPSLIAQDFLSFCYNQVARNLINSDFTRASYTFQVLTSLLIKFKWAIRRDQFKQTSIARNVLQLCRQLSQSNFQGEMLTLRKQLFKIITNISFDDILDDYRTNINELIINLQKSLAQNRWKAMYDLTGICQAIDTSAIYRYFMVSLQKSNIPIRTIMNQLFSLADSSDAKQKQSLIRSILKLQLSIITNKGQRLTGTKNTFINYKLISSLMPYWVLMLQLPEFSNSAWDQSIAQIYGIFNTLLKNNNTNFFMLERTIDSYPDFMRGFFANMVTISEWVELYPSLFQEYRMAMHQISKELMEVIFCNADQQIVFSFNQLLGIFMKYSIKCIESICQGNKSAEEVLEIYLDIIKNVFKYLRNAKRLLHKLQQIQNIRILSQQIQIKYIFVAQLFKFGISTGKKMLRIRDLICKVIHNMDFLARTAMPSITNQLGLAEPYKQKLLQIWTNGQENDSQFSEELQDAQFLSQIKQWFQKCDFSIIQTDY